MRIGIVGAGFCGLATCWHLLERGFTDITVFDSLGIGGGASGMAAGLMHPYPGLQGRKSLRADEGMMASRELFAVAERALGKPICDYGGIVRLTPVLQSGPDIVSLDGECHLILSGITVYSELYLQGLWKACSERGARLVVQTIDSAEALCAYDRIVIAAGSGVGSFLPDKRLSFVKGQILKCEWPASRGPLERSMIGSGGYLAKDSVPLQCHLGSTYEREFASSAPCMHTAKKQLSSKGLVFFGAEPRILECKAGIRVGVRGTYYPLLLRLTPKVWVITGMKSRGLLYHALFAKEVAFSIN